MSNQRQLSLTLVSNPPHPPHKPRDRKTVHIIRTICVVIQMPGHAPSLHPLGALQLRTVDNRARRRLVIHSLTAYPALSPTARSPHGSEWTSSRL